MTEPNVTREHWLEQKYRAKSRGIPFRFTWEEWRGWWLVELAKRGPDARRGRKAGDWLMCRFNDVGAYEPGNVYCGSRADNGADTDWSHAAERARARISWLRGTVGADHPRSKAITTKGGTFPSITAAAEYHGVSRTEVRRRLAVGRL